LPTALAAPWPSTLALELLFGRDARETSPELAGAVARGICDAGPKVLDLGMAGTEEMYWAVTEFGATAGIEFIASHNPINYNGLKIVKSGSRPLDDVDDFQVIKRLAEAADWAEGSGVLRQRDLS
jgi:phosphomannomutase